MGRIINPVRKKIRETREVGGVLVPDPEGFPVYQDPRDGKAYRCIAAYANAGAGVCWNAFEVREDRDGDIIFWGYIEQEGNYRYETFSRNEVRAISRFIMEFNPVDLQGCEPPTYPVGDGTVARFKKIDGPVKKPEWYIKNHVN